MSKPAFQPKPRWLANFDEAEALISQGDSRAATPLLRKAVKLNPSLTAGWRLLADISMAGGDFAGARFAYQHAAASTLGDAELHKATIARAEGRLGDAEWILRDCLAQGPDFYEARVCLAQLLFGARHFIEALAEFDRLLAADAVDCRSLTMKAAALTEIGRYGEAAAISAEVVRRFPDQGYAWLVHAGGLRALGDTAGCIAAYRRCLELDPSRAEAWLSLANLKTYRFTDDETAAMETALVSAALTPEDEAKLHFAIGKAREDAADHASAFEHFARGNAIERSLRNYDPAPTSAYVVRSRNLFTADFFAERAGWGAPEPDPIFIVGLPRSGSTLVEQILASHPAVEGTHELPDLPAIAATVRGYPEGLAGLRRETCAALGADYLRRTRVYRILGRPRFIDKTPKNFLHIGFIRLTLPGARIVDVRRHPLACGLSIFKQHFGQGFASAFDLGHIGAYYADYVSLMAHIDEAQPGAVHRVVYEDLVADTESEVRRLLDYLDLTFDAACLRFFDNPRAVDTPSAEQVRQPIFADAVDHWRHFEPWLAPLKSALGPVLDAYPAAPPGWDKISR